MTPLSKKQQPYLGSKKANDQTQRNRQKRRDHCPLKAFGFFIYGIDGCGARIVQQTKQHQVDAREQGTATGPQYFFGILYRV